MDSYSRIQEDIRLKIIKGKNNFKKSPKDRITISYLETRLETLEKQWSSYCDIHMKIISEIKEEELKKSVYYTSDAYDQTEELYITYKSELKESILGLKCVPGNNDNFCEPSVSGGIQSLSVKLPKISIPSFSGIYTQWTSFRDLFVSLIHNNKGLDDVQRLHYLKSHLTGEAEQLLRHIPITMANYKVCWAQLENRYNNKRYLANCILKRFMSHKNVLSESSSAIKELLDTTNECLSALSNLGIDIGTWDVIIIYIVSLKLDTESRKLWEVQVSKSSDDLPKLTDFLEFLDHRFKSLEFLDHKVCKPSYVRNNNPKALHVTTTGSCIFCSESHKLCFCKKFVKEDVDARRNFAQTNRLCFNCLGSNHSVSSCRQSTNCRICKRRHHSLLHPKSPPHIEQSSQSLHVSQAAPVPSAPNNEASNIVTCFSNLNSQILLATALVKVESRNGSTFVLRSLLDQGSQASFITESAVQMLGLKKIPNMSNISGLGSDQATSLQSKWYVLINIQSRQDPHFSMEVKAHVLSKLTSLLPDRKIALKLLSSKLTALELADPYFDTPNKINLLLGAEVYCQILLQGVIKDSPGFLVAQKTKLGWILSGQINSPANNSNRLLSLHTQVSENDLLKKFWEIEEVNTVSKKYLTEEEELCEEMYTKTVKRDELGRYIVKLPFKTSNPQCQYGNSYDIARKRFHMLERRLLNNPELRVQYSGIINEYLALNHMEIVPKKEIMKPTAVYIPHHPVIRNDKITTKVRVVFDASCHLNNGTSLNGNLMVGPTLQFDLRHIIMRWRCYPIGLIADIIKMYRQVKVAEDDVDFQRLLWRDNPTTEIQHLRLLRVTFGTASAPYLAVKSLQQLSYDEGLNHPLAADKVLNEFYVDDLMTGCETVEEGLQLYQEVTELLSRGGFELQKWTCSNNELLQVIQKGKSDSKENFEINSDSIMKILGLTWNRMNDEFQYTVQLAPLETPVTKRKVISDIARLYDPLGWIAPVITTAKVFIQKIWLSGIEWDEELPSQLLNEWIIYRHYLCHLTHFRLPRWVRTSKGNSSVDLQGFCDASIAAYAAVVYIRVIDGEGIVSVNLVASKTKVAPVKQVSIPRLELCGAVLLAKLLQEVSTALSISMDRVHAWTDSSVVLSWLSSHPSKWKTFVANRVSEILSIMDRSQWAHVRSEHNPADCASRGTNSCDFTDHEIWKSGPNWLNQPSVNYDQGGLSETNLEERKEKVLCHMVLRDTEEIITRFSNLGKLTRTISYCRRFLMKLRKETYSKTLSAKEIHDSLLACVRICQSIGFNEDIDNLKNQRNIKKNSKLASLNPFIDGEGILRVGGRLRRGDMTRDMKHPILIPNKSHLTNLLITDAHERTLHGGPQLMLNYLRTKYWIINAKNLVRHCYRKCIICIRYSGHTTQQLMGQLPPSRITANRPFYQCGVDYAGPISIRPTKGRGYHSTKGYISLFICMATRAIHLELVSDLTSEAFIAAFRRFVARRGHCGDMWSDNGTTFVGANKELKSLVDQKSIVARDIANWLVSNGTNWHFIPPRSPNFGGLWESGVKSTKHHLKRVVGNSTLTFEEMTTLLSQIEACLNSRPISQTSSNPEDPYPLTPGHFLIGEPLLLVPDYNLEQSNLSTLKRWHFAQRLVQDFWRRWSQEYLTQLHHRYKWKHQVPEPNIGDIVLVKEDDLPPSKWLYGRITEKHVGLDNLTRVVSLRCKSSIIKRSVSKLIILPITT